MRGIPIPRLTPSPRPWEQNPPPRLLTCEGVAALSTSWAQVLESVRDELRIGPGAQTARRPRGGNGSWRVTRGDEAARRGLPADRFRPCPGGRRARFSLPLADAGVNASCSSLFAAFFEFFSKNAPNCLVPAKNSSISGMASIWG